MAGLRKQVRVRRARRQSACPECSRLIIYGDLIVSVRGGPWQCVGHVLPRAA